MLTENEKKLIIGLRQAGSGKITRIAEKMGIPKSTLFELLRRLEREGVIHRSTRVDFERLGFPARMFLVLKTTPGGRAKLEEHLKSDPNVNTLHRVDSDYDFHVDTIFRNRKDAKEFIESLDAKHILLEKMTIHAIETIHSERFLSEEGHFAR